MSINLHLPPKQETLLRPTITVVGVGGAGGNAVNNMIAAGLEGVNFVVANTDAQALDNALTDRAIQLGADITRGLGAGANPDVGRAAADESNEEIASHINGSHMVFITAGMGGGTGTGAAPVVARIAREQGILTVGVVTKPFQFEGTHRMKMAEAGIEELQKFVDTLIVIPNQNLFRVANERTTFADAFRMADEVLHSGVRGVTDLMVKPGLVNLDFADIRTVMGEMGKAMMGTGEAAGERRAIEAAEAAISNPLLDDVSLKGAHAVLINITGGLDMTLFEVDEAANRIRDEVDPDANIIFGSTFNEAMEGKMRVSVVATGIDATVQQNRPSAASAADGAKRPFSFPNTQRPEVPRLSKPVATPVAASLPPPREAQQHEPVMARMVGASPLTSQSRFNFVQNAAMQQEAALLETGDVKANALSFASTVTTIGAAQPTEQFDAQQRAIPPQAEAPAGNPTVQQVRALYAQRPVPEYNSPRQSRPTQPDRDEPTVLSFFQRVTGMGRALAAARSEAPERAVQVSERPRAVERPRAEVAEKRQPQPQEEEYLDIPAFLRRQAN